MPKKLTIAVVNGERYWHDFLPDFDVRYCQLQTSQWFFDGENVFLTDSQGVSKIDAVLWRVGAIRPHPLHRAVLEIIRLSKIICVNSAESLLRGFDRLSMRAEMQEIKIPLINQVITTGYNALNLVETPLPNVVKVGNFHAGLGKIKVETVDQFSDVKDVTFSADDYVTVEPFIDYVRDVRCLAINDNIWGLERRGSTWKANTQTIDYKLVEVPQILSEYTSLAMKHLGSDILGLDFLENQNGEFVLLETNDVPGLSGFPDSLKYLLAKCIEDKVLRK